MEANGRKGTIDRFDGFQSYWHDLDLKCKHFWTRQREGDAVMFQWVMSPIAINGTVRSERQCNIIETGLCLFAAEISLQNWIFQK